MNNKILSRYVNICPIDHKFADFSDILKFGTCKEHFEKIGVNIWEAREKGLCDVLGFEKENCLLEQRLKDYIEFFEKNFGRPPFSLNIYWAKKVLRGESFSITAPTGFGKTTFGITISHFYPGKICYLVPSKILLSEVSEKLKLIKSDKRILVTEDKDIKEKLEKGEFDILVSTANFLHKNYDLFPKNFDLVFIDDADSLVRQPQNIDKVLKLVKVTDSEIELALKNIDAKRKAKNKEEFLKVKSLDINRKEKGIVIAASATLTPRTKRILLFKEILGFEIGQSGTHLRNIEEVYEFVEEKDLWERSLFWIKKLGQGGFVFLSSIYRLEDLDDYLKFLEANGIKAISYQKFNTKNRKKFEEGFYQVVVGFSNVRNPLTRGIDLPASVRYALFVSIPQFKINLNLTNLPMPLFIFSLTLREFVEDEHLKRELDGNIRFLRKISFLKEEAIKKREGLLERLEKTKEFLKSLTNIPEVKEKMMQSPRIRFNISEDSIELKVSDPRGYLQASGRTSRLFPLGLTKGLSLVLVEDKKIFQHLKEKLNLLGYKSEFKDAKEINFEEILKKIDNDREIVKRVIKGEEIEFKDPVKSCLVIVESPTKARTIARFFGKPARRVVGNLNVSEISIGDLNINIVASIGHITDLSLDYGFWGVMIENNKFIPTFQPIKICAQCERHLDFEEKSCPVCSSQNFLSKEEIIRGLQKLASEVDFVLLVTDPDTEGEKIAFDLYAYLYPYNRNIKRMELHEITREEFLKGLKNLRDLNLNLVKAQLLRRISDRWIGFSLSQEVQKKFKNLALSAGRVQTPVLGWLIKKQERSKEKKYIISTTINGQNFFFETKDKELVKKLRKEKKELHLYWKILQKEERILKPMPPYETGEILKDAATILRFDSSRTMRILQDLFEQGLITYHRTDSIFVSNVGKLVAREYLTKKDMEKLNEPRNWGKPGAHECIRPTKALDVQDLIEEMYLSGERRLTKDHLRLYGLIFDRFLSSEMIDAKVIWIKGEAEINGLKTTLEGPMEFIEKGCFNFYKPYKIISLQPGKYPIENLSIKRVPIEFPYTQGALIDEMKKKGLGRPSTYATIVETIAERRYVIKKQNYLIPTKLGQEVYEFLMKSKGKNFVSEEFTRKLEESMDKIETGEVDYQKLIGLLYKKIQNLIKKT
jgi:reverse gyrase